MIVYDLMNLLGPAASIRARAQSHRHSRHMAARDDVALCPLIYGYVNYAAPSAGRALGFHNAPVTNAGARPGSTLGGTGIAVSRRCDVTPELIEHLTWLMVRRRKRASFPTMRASRRADRPGATRR